MFIRSKDNLISRFQEFISINILFKFIQDIIGGINLHLKLNEILLVQSYLISLFLLTHDKMSLSYLHFIYLTIHR